MEKFSFYNKCIIRTSLYSWSSIENNSLENTINLPGFNEAIYIASPTLYNEIFVNHNYSLKTQNSLMKYFSRSCIRNTPYGIFAGISVVPITANQNSEIHLSDMSKYRTYTRIDMNYLSNLIRSIENDSYARYKLLYHVNSSLYLLWNKYRYIDYRIINNKREYTFSEIKSTSYLNKLISVIKETEMSIYDIAALIEEREKVNQGDALEYVNQLIENKILVSNLEPSVCGKDLIFQIEHELSRVGIRDKGINTIIEIIKKCDECSIGKHAQYYDEIYKVLNAKTFTFYNENPLHVDCSISIERGQIGENIVSAVRKGIDVLRRITRKEPLPELEKFKSKFYDLYEEEEIPLTVALDTQIGVGYAHWINTNGDSDPVLKGIPFFSSKEVTNTKHLKMDRLTYLLFDKYKKAIKDESSTIFITDEDLIFFPEHSQAISSQEYIIFSVTNNTEKPEIILTGVGTATAAKLLSRFEYLSKDVEQLVNEITKDEQKKHSKSIIAEILHLPEDRIGNVQMHPNNRDYGICYFSNPCSHDVKNIIPISDIMISVPRGEKIILRSKKFNKMIIPRLSTAHNYMYGLPIYHFLCDLQFQEYTDYSFNWGQLFMAEPYLPRVQYENLILAPARWLITPKDYPNYKEYTGTLLLEKMNEWRKKYKMPSKFLIVEGDNKLYIDLKNCNLISVLLEEFKKNKNLQIEEFCYSNDKKNLVTRGGKPFTNEIIMCIKN